MKIYGLKTCDSCRKAQRALPVAEFVDIRADGMPDGLLEAAWQAFGAALLNTRSTTWRNLPEAEREEPPLTLIRRHPALMKRPLIDTEGGGPLYLGWSGEVQAALV
jgi:arsenate reductase